MSFAGRIPVEIDYQNALYVENVDGASDTPQKIHKFADGTAGRSAGTSAHKITLTFALPEERNRVYDYMSSRKSFVCAITTGGAKWLYTDCGLSNEKFGSNSDGDASLSITFDSPGRVRLR
jgi:hypothetical protein